MVADVGRAPASFMSAHATRAPSSFAPFRPRASQIRQSKASRGRGGAVRPGALIAGLRRESAVAGRAWWRGCGIPGPAQGCAGCAAAGRGRSRKDADADVDTAPSSTLTLGLEWEDRSDQARARPHWLVSSSSWAQLGQPRLFSRAHAPSCPAGSPPFLPSSGARLCAGRALELGGSSS